MGFAAHRKRHVRRKTNGQRTRLKHETAILGKRPANDKYSLKVATGICESIARGNTLEVAASMNGVCRATLWQWVRAGDADPDGPYGAFAQEVAYAQDVAHSYMVRKLIDHDDWRATSFIMKNRWPKLYRDHVVQELTGADGGPVAMGIQSFNVVLELHQKEEHNGSEQSEPAFRIDAATAAVSNLAKPGGPTTR